MASWNWPFVIFLAENNGSMFRCKVKNAGPQESQLWVMTVTLWSLPFLSSFSSPLIINFKIWLSCYRSVISNLFIPLTVQELLICRLSFWFFKIPFVKHAQNMQFSWFSWFDSSASQVSFRRDTFFVLFMQDSTWDSTCMSQAWGKLLASFCACRL